MEAKPLEEVFHYIILKRTYTFWQKDQIGYIFDV